MAAKLKTKISNSLVNVYVPKKAVELKTGSKGFEFAEVKLGGKVFLIDAKFVHLTAKKDKYSIGIILDREYTLKGSDESAMGVDIKNFYFDLKAEEKEAK